jgi:hypothetical protein
VRQRSASRRRSDGSARIQLCARNAAHTIEQHRCRQDRSGFRSRNA